MSNQIQPSPYHAACFTDLFGRLSDVLDANPYQLSLTLTNLLLHYILANPDDAGEAIRDVGVLQSALIAIANNDELVNVGENYFQNQTELSFEKEGTSC